MAEKDVDLSLSGLTMPEFDTVGLKARFEAGMAQQERYRQLYGDGWWDKYCQDMGRSHNPGFDLRAKAVNRAIYEKRRCYDVRGPYQFNREHELFGDAYDALQDRKICDPRVAELLLADAVRTGKWKELPDELQAEYHRRIGGA